MAEKCCCKKKMVRVAPQPHSASSAILAAISLCCQRNRALTAICSRIPRPRADREKRGRFFCASVTAGSCMFQAMSTLVPEKVMLQR